MRYLGGKTKLAREIVSVIRPRDYPFVWEPFCGGGSVTSEICRVLAGTKTAFLATDIRPELIAMWQAVKAGWEPPELGRNLTDSEYQALKSAADSPIRTFVGFGCSFGGKYWGGLARDAIGTNYYEQARKSVLSKTGLLQAHMPVFAAVDFLSLTSPPPTGTLVYCDPPYAGTTGYGMAFDHDRFWSICRWLARAGCAVFVSEFTAPDFCCEVWRKERKIAVNGTIRDSARADCLFEVNQ